MREVSLDIPAGEVTALLGPNGAGKSSLVLAVAGVLRPTGGRVLLTSDEEPGANGAVAGRTTSLAAGPSGSAPRAWRSSPRAGGCCPS